jgi:hypothetical protein
MDRIHSYSSSTRMYALLETWGDGGPPSIALRPAAAAAVGGAGAGAAAIAAAKPVILATPESRALQVVKNQIDLFYEEGKWDDYKKITNPYEYIFLSWNRRSSHSVAIRQPLSRSYFKMIEMWKRMELDDELEALVERDGGLVTAHAAEGPGGFIEACTVSADRNGWDFREATAITLRSEAKNVPGWRKAARFLESHPQIRIHDGADGTGNILRLENQAAYVAAVRATHPEGAHLFTADGGFDFSNDYNAQEDTVFPLLVAEIVLGLKTLAKGGALVVKCFDTKEAPTLQLLWLTSRAFTSWGVLKPRTSRAGNAERYIVGKGFHGDCEDILALLDAYQTTGNFTRPLFEPPAVECPTWRPFVAKLATLQEQIEHVEIEVIQETLRLIKHTETAVIRLLVRANVQRSIEWCREHDELVAAGWATDLERNIARETSDLMHILCPSNTLSYAGWTARNTSASTLSFSGFRAAAPAAAAAATSTT